MAGLGDKFSRHAQGFGAVRSKESGSQPPVAAETEPRLSPEMSRPAGESRPILTEIPLSQIEADPNQPRRDLGDLSELAASIRELGLIQPIIVSVVGYERYRVLAGERRFTAAGKAGLVRIPAIVALAGRAPAA